MNHVEKLKAFGRELTWILGLLAFLLATPLYWQKLGPVAIVVFVLGLAMYGLIVLSKKFHPDTAMPSVLRIGNAVVISLSSILMAFIFGLLPPLLAQMHGGALPPPFTSVVGNGYGTSLFNGLACWASFLTGLIALILAGFLPKDGVNNEE